MPSSLCNLMTLTNLIATKDGRETRDATSSSSCELRSLSPSVSLLLGTSRPPERRKERSSF